MQTRLLNENDFFNFLKKEDYNNSKNESKNDINISKDKKTPVTTLNELQLLNNFYKKYNFPQTIANKIYNSQVSNLMKRLKSQNYNKLLDYAVKISIIGAYIISVYEKQKILYILSRYNKKYEFPNLIVTSKTLFYILFYDLKMLNKDDYENKNGKGFIADEINEIINNIIENKEYDKKLKTIISNILKVKN